MPGQSARAGTGGIAPGAMPRKIERPEQRVVERRDVVGEGRGEEAGMELPCDKKPAGLRLAFEHDGAEAGAAQERRRHQPIRARADDRRVVPLRHSPLPRGPWALKDGNPEREQYRCNDKGRKQMFPPFG